MKTGYESKTAKFTNNLDLAVKLGDKVKDRIIRDIWKLFRVRVRALEVTVDESEYKLGKT